MSFRTQTDQPLLKSAVAEATLEQRGIGSLFGKIVKAVTPSKSTKTEGSKPLLSTTTKAQKSAAAADAQLRKNLGTIGIIDN
jgi:hypothetical protein